MGKFERYLSIWVLGCIVLGIFIGQFSGDSVSVISQWEIATVNIPVAILVWLMIYPMMVQIDFSSIKDVGKNWKGLGLTVFINWVVKPFTMAFFAWIFFDQLFKAWINPEDAQQYMAGAILLGAAPCTAMVFVWSYLTRGDANYTLVQVSVNDLILLVAFIPIVRFLLGITDIEIPYNTLLSSVVIFVVIPLLAGYISNKLLIRRYGMAWFKDRFLARLKPLSITALLLTLVLLFAFQGEKILAHPLALAHQPCCHSANHQPQLRRGIGRQAGRRRLRHEKLCAGDPENRTHHQRRQGIRWSLLSRALGQYRQTGGRRKNDCCRSAGEKRADISRHFHLQCENGGGSGRTAAKRPCCKRRPTCGRAAALVRLCSTWRIPPLFRQNLEGEAVTADNRRISFPK
jgi:arsenite transporter